MSVPRRDFPFQPLFPAGAFRRNLRDDGADFSFERACTCFRRRHFSRKNGADLSVQRAVFRAVGKKAGGNRRARRVSSGKRQPTDAAAGAAAESDSIGLRGAFMQRLAVFPAGGVRLLDHSGGKLSPGLQCGGAFVPRRHRVPLYEAALRARARKPLLPDARGRLVCLRRGRNHVSACHVSGDAAGARFVEACAGGALRSAGAAGCGARKISHGSVRRIVVACGKSAARLHQRSGAAERGGFRQGSRGNLPLVRQMERLLGAERTGDLPSAQPRLARDSAPGRSKTRRSAAAASGALLPHRQLPACGQRRAFHTAGKGPVSVAPCRKPPDSLRPVPRFIKAPAESCRALAGTG